MRYEALLTVRQQELLMMCEEKIVTIPALWSELKELNEEWELPHVSYQSIYVSMRILERRRLVMRNPGWTIGWTTPHEWTATEEGREALELSLHDTLTPSR